MLPDDDLLREEHLHRSSRSAPAAGRSSASCRTAAPRPATRDLAGELLDDVIARAACEPELAPILLTMPLQLLAYDAAIALGRDVDQPRNLAKSVTVA